MTTSWRLVRGAAAVWRGPGRLQVGDAVLAAPLGAEVALNGAGTGPLARVAAQAGVPAPWLREALLALAGRGLAERVGARAAVGVVGSGTLAAAVLGALAEHEVRLHDPRPGALASPEAVLAARHPNVVLTPDLGDVAVVVLAGSAGARDRATALVRADQPHVLLEAAPAGASVGPLVIPGVSACRRCLDLVLAGLDGAWPQVAAQLDAREADVDPAAAAWAAGLAAAQVVAYLRGGTPSLVGATWTLRDGAQELRRWVVHPDCGCAGVARLEDERGPVVALDQRERRRDVAARGTMAA